MVALAEISNFFFMNFSERLKKVRLDILKLSRAACSKVLGVPEITIKCWEMNKAKITESSLNKIMPALKEQIPDITKTWLLEGKGPPPMGIQVFQRRYIPIKMQKPFHISLKKGDVANFEKQNVSELSFPVIGTLSLEKVELMVFSKIKDQLVYHTLSKPSLLLELENVEIIYVLKSIDIA